MDPFIGQIQLFGFNFAPRGWAFCEGQLLSISANSALFSLLGTTYGGDGRTTFGLPDLRGRVPVGAGTGPGLSTMSWGERGGAETTTLITNNLPPHSHPVNQQVNNDTAGLTSDPTGKRLGGSGNLFTSQTGELVDMAPLVVGNTGGGQAVNNMQPHLGLYYSIALQGVYPSRN